MATPRCSCGSVAVRVLVSLPEGCTTYVICPLCDRVRCRHCDHVDLSGFAAHCQCGTPLILEPSS